MFSHLKAKIAYGAVLERVKGVSKETVVLRRWKLERVFRCTRARNLQI